MLNAEQIIEKGILKLENSKGKPAQVGYDLSVKSINAIGNVNWNISDPRHYISNQPQIGFVFKDKTELNVYREVETKKLEGKEGYLLYQGAYDITFWEGCKIPSNLVGFIRQRSSLLRNGAVMHSSVFDPGFETDNMGCILIVNCTIFIECDARVAQMYFHHCDEVAQENLYNGQWQNDKQRG